jgi:hypothetical protein
MADVAPNASQPTAGPFQKFVLWVDGAGGALVLLGDEVTIGGFRHDANRSDVCLLSNLARKHLTITRENGSYEILTHQSITLANEAFATDPNERISLTDKTEWNMGDGVVIRFRQPTVLSLTAVLDFQSSHRPLVGQPPVAVDQVILMDQNCLIGPGNGQHIKLKNCEDGVILYQSKNQLWCKSKTPFSKNEEPPETTVSLQSGDIITGRDYRFRLEAMDR